MYKTWLGLLFWVYLTLSGKTSGRETDVNVVVKEGEDAVLPCSISTKENIVRGLFDWKKDGQKEVFMYNAGVYYQNGRSGQDEHFRGRVSHFSEQLEFGNASITITNTKLGDSGNYTCVFPKTNPGEIYYISLAVAHFLKDRSGEKSGARFPYVSIADVTEAGVLLQCVVQCAYPEPTLQWQDCGGNILPAEEPQVSDRGGCYDVILQTTVTKMTSNCFYCEVKQDNISHVVNKRITVPERLFESCHSVSISMFIGGLFAGVLLVAVALALLIGANIISCRRGSGHQICNREIQQLRPDPQVL